MHPGICLKFGNKTKDRRPLRCKTEDRRQEEEVLRAVQWLFIFLSGSAAVFCLAAQRSSVSLHATRAEAEELQLVIEVAETGFVADFLLQLMHRAGGGDGLDGAAAGADEVVGARYFALLDCGWVFVSFPILFNLVPYLCLSKRARATLFTPYSSWMKRIPTRYGTFVAASSGIVVSKPIDHRVPKGVVKLDEQGLTQGYPNIVNHKEATPKVRNRKILRFGERFAVLVHTTEQRVASCRRV